MCYLFFFLFLLALFWINPLTSSGQTIETTVVVCAFFVVFFFPLIFSLPVWLGGITGSVMILAGAWGAAEWLTLKLPFVIPLHFALSLYDWPLFIQAARYFGVIGVSCLLVLVNAALAKAWIGRSWGWLAIALALFSANLAFGVFQIGFQNTRLVLHPTKTINLAIMNSPLQGLPAVDLLLMPELAFSDYTLQIDERGFAWLKGRKALVGTRYFDSNQHCSFNAAALLAGGQIAGLYRKQHLVPLIENEAYHAAVNQAPVWAGSVLGWLGVEICSDVLYPEISRGLALQGAELFVLLSNDEWFGASNWPILHAAYLPFRAVENQLWLVAANHRGYSAVVDANGCIRRVFRSQFQTPYFVQAEEML